jgi:bifunctional DNA-binding transcriptional regulator/antitoxin component of YhaV-PrlF toxin-antitoxin module
MEDATMGQFTKGRLLFGMSVLDKAGRILLPEAAREKFGLFGGESVAILGDDRRGMTIVRADTLKRMLDTTGARAFIEGEFLLGTSAVDEAGGIILPEAARKTFGLRPGDAVIVIGEETRQGPALLKADIKSRAIAFLLDTLNLNAKNGGHDKFAGRR